MCVLVHGEEQVQGGEDGGRQGMVRVWRRHAAAPLLGGDIAGALPAMRQRAQEERVPDRGPQLKGDDGWGRGSLLTIAGGGGFFWDDF